MPKAPKSVKQMQNMMSMRDFDAKLTESFIRYINQMDNSFNPPPVIRERSLSAINVADMNKFWLEDASKGLHNDTVWMYYGSPTGMAQIFPGNYWGRMWDPTRRPWYDRAISNLDASAAISTPYVSPSGAGLMNTIASVVWGSSRNGRRKVEGVVGYDYLYPKMNNFLPDSTGCAKDDVRSRERHTACFLIETSGLLLTHSDFLLTKEQNDINSNVFLGKKEPDLADALINDGIIKYIENKKSPDSKQLLNYYSVDRDAFKSSNVLHGTLEGSLKCLNASEPITWYISEINGTNAFLLTVENYLRKYKECEEKTQAAPSKTIVHSTCEEISTDASLFKSRSSSYQEVINVCPKCLPGSYREVAVTSSKSTCAKCAPGMSSFLQTSSKCETCSAGKYSLMRGAEKCTSCINGQFSFEKGSSKPDTCKLCPTGGYCPGGNRLEAIVQLLDEGEDPNVPLVQKAYWRSSVNATMLYECPIPSGKFSLFLPNSAFITFLTKVHST